MVFRLNLGATVGDLKDAISRECRCISGYITLYWEDDEGNVTQYGDGGGGDDSDELEDGNVFSVEYHESMQMMLWDYEEVFTNKWAELEESAISDIVNELTGIMGTGQFNSIDPNPNDNPLYHWTCIGNCMGIAGNHYRDLDIGDDGELSVYHIGGVNPTSNPEHTAEEVYNYYVGGGGDLDPLIYGTIREVENLATYLYVIKNVAVYFSQDRCRFKQLTVDNCGTPVCLWEHNVPWPGFLYINDPEAGDAIMVIPGDDDGLVPVSLYECDDPVAHAA
jgi:hypothetical protein